MDIYNLVYLIGSLFMTYVIRKFFQVFYYEKQVDIKIELIFYFLYFIFTTSIYLITRIPVIMMISNFLLLFLISFIYIGSIKKRLLSVLIIYISLVSIETIVVVVLNYTDLNFYIPSKFDSIFGSIVIRILSFIFVIVLHRVIHIKKELPLPLSYWASLFIIPISTILLLFAIFSTTNISNTWILVTISCAFLINITTFYLYDNILRSTIEQMNNRLLREQQKYYDYQMKIMKRTLRDTRKLNHDLKNKLSPIYKIAKANENEELLNFVSKLMNGYYPIKEYSKTGNTCIDSILNYKLSEAQKNNITISTEIIFPSKLKINTLDLAVILGNLIDNAMEGAQTVKKNNPWIDIKLKYTKGRLIININNSFDGFVYKQGDKIISRKDKSQNHGLGLDSVKDIIKKYNGIISTNYNQDTFKVKVLMYV